MATQASDLATLYEQDYYLWLEKMVQLLQAVQLEDLDLANLAEEIADMGKSERRAVESNLEIVLMHLLKYQYQPERRSSIWRYTLLEHRRRLEQALRDSPSLRTYVEVIFADTYRAACRLTAVETDQPLGHLPLDCPFTLEQVFDLDYLPD
jgi:hypothetical protein